MTQHVMQPQQQQQVHQQVHQQQLSQQQINQLKQLSTHQVCQTYFRAPAFHARSMHSKVISAFCFQQQILLNQQNQTNAPTRIITPQGTIITPNLQSPIPRHTLTQQQQQQPTQNGPPPQQNSLPSMRQPHQQAKKATVQPNNATNDMDDLEESITAAVLTKHSLGDSMPQYHTPPPPPPSQRPAAPTMVYSSPHSYQQPVYEQQQIPRPQMSQHAPTVSQLLMEPESPDDERQILTLQDGQRITLAEYKRMRLMQQSHSQHREAGRQTLVRNKEPQRPVQRVPPMQSQQAPVPQQHGEWNVSSQFQKKIT